MLVAGVAVIAAIHVILLVLVLALCGKKKEKKPTSQTLANEQVARFSRRSTTGSNRGDEEAAYASVDLPSRRSNEMDSKTSSDLRQARMLPDIPSHEVTSSSAQRPNSHSDHSSLGSGESTRRHSNSPKGRRLPTPPELSSVVPGGDHHDTRKSMNDGDLDDESNVYAKVEDTAALVAQPSTTAKSSTAAGCSSSSSVAKKPAKARMMIKTLDIKEGSGDSSFYAKVGDVVVDEGSSHVVDDEADLYAQVNDVAQSWVRRDSNTSSAPVASPPLPKPNNPAQQQPSTSGTGNNQDGPEYATIDKVGKKQVKQTSLMIRIHRTTTSSETSEPTQPAPPIPDRNFVLDTDDDELDEGDDDGGGLPPPPPVPLLAPSLPIPHIDDDLGPPLIPAVQINGGGEMPVQAAASSSNSGGPTYDKVCVRESLDHVRIRQELESERRARYANLQHAINNHHHHHEDDDEPAVYAQIEDESVYESLSANGSADGSYQPRPPLANHQQQQQQAHSSNQETGFTASSSSSSSHRPQHYNSNNNSGRRQQREYSEIEFRDEQQRIASPIRGRPRQNTPSPRPPSLDHQHNAENEHLHHYEQIHRV